MKCVKNSFILTFLGLLLCGSPQGLLANEIQNAPHSGSHYFRFGISAPPDRHLPHHSEKVLRASADPDAVRVPISPRHQIGQLLEELTRDQSLFDAFVEVFLTDPYWAAQALVMRTPEFELGRANGMIRQEYALALGATGRNIKIGLMDTGVSKNPSSDLRDQILGSEDFFAFDDEVLTYPINESGHGDMVGALAIGARNGFGSHGTAPDARLKSYKVSSVETDLAPRTIKRAAQAYNKAHREGMAILTGAWGYRDVDDVLNYPEALYKERLAPLADAIRGFRTTGETDGPNRGTVAVFAAGNRGEAHPDNLMAHLPRYYPELEGLVVSVVGLDATTYDPATWDPSDAKLAHYSAQCGITANWCIAAPAHGAGFVQNHDIFLGGAGTSAATAVTSGAIATIMSSSPELTAEQAVQILFMTATDLGEPGVDPEFGHGLINLQAALAPIGGWYVPIKHVSKDVSSTTVRSLRLPESLFKSLADKDGVLLELEFVFEDMFGRQFSANLSVIADSTSRLLTLPLLAVVEPQVIAEHSAVALGVIGASGFVYHDAGLGFAAGTAQDLMPIANSALPLHHVHEQADAVVFTATVNQRMSFASGAFDNRGRPAAVVSADLRWHTKNLLQIGSLVEFDRVLGTSATGAAGFDGQTITSWITSSISLFRARKFDISLHTTLGYLDYEADRNYFVQSVAGTMFASQIRSDYSGLILPSDRFAIEAGIPFQAVRTSVQGYLPTQAGLSKYSLAALHRPTFEVRAKWAARF